MYKILYMLVNLLWILCSMPVLFVLYMFAFSFVTGFFIVKTPLKPLLIVNLSVSITAAVVLLAENILFGYWLVGGANLFLVGLMFLLILLPNFVLYIKSRKQQGEYIFKKHIQKSIILFLCHIPSMVLIFWYATGLFVMF